MSNKVTHWVTSDNEVFIARPDEKESDKLPPGIYKIKQTMVGVLFVKTDYKQDELLKFEDTIAQKAVDEIKSFWTKKKLFKRHSFAFKRGILFYGPPGSGKSSTVKIIVNDVINSGGLAIIFSDPELFRSGMDIIRKIQPDTPVVAIMEDIDSLMYNYDNSEILNILDGVTGYDDIVYLATTNYIDKLEGRIKNRPSRFDRRFLVDFPSDKARKQYFEFLIDGNNELPKFSIDCWVKDTKGLSIAHLKELFMSVLFFSSDYSETLNRLKTMTSPEDFSKEEDDEDEDEYDDDSEGTYLQPPNDVSVGVGN
jgi:SpoVK/Ycf46/Vps4 family AAA+-type ATPase